MAKKRNEIKKEDKWDLEVLFKDINDVYKEMDNINLLASKLIKYKNKIIDNLYSFLDLDDQISQKNEKVYVYTYLKYYEDMGDNNSKILKEKVDKFEEELSLKLSFALPELLSNKYDEILKKIKEDKKLDKYSFKLEKLFRYQKYTLSTKEEKIITAASNALGSVDDVFDNIDNVDIKLGYIKDDQGKKVELTNANYSVYIKSKNQSVRKQAFKHLYNYFIGLNNTIAACYTGSIKESFFISDIRKYSSPLEASLYQDNIPVSLYNNLIDEVHNYLPSMYKYELLRKKYLKLDKLHMYDIYLPLGKISEDKIPFNKGKEILFEALKPLGTNYIKDLNEAFDNGWIDKYENIGKRSGAYEWGNYGNHPYVSVNYMDDYNSLDTLGHELGHAMHTYYSNKKQDYIYAGYPIFLAEIASTVNETLIDSYFAKHAKNKEEKIYYLSNFLEKVRTTIYRQTMFAEFEKIIHDKYQSNIPITTQELNKTYYELNELYFGKNVVSDKEIAYEWSRIPHFYTPFYVYKYATGLSCALAIVSKLLTEDDYKDTYINKFLSIH